MTLENLFFLLAFIVCTIYLAQEYAISKTLFISDRKPYKLKILIVLFPLLSFLSHSFYNVDLHIYNLFHFAKILSTIVILVIVVNYRFSTFLSVYNVKYTAISLVTALIILIAELIFIKMNTINLSDVPILISTLVLYALLLVYPGRLFYFLFLIRSEESKYHKIYIIIAMFTTVGVILDLLFYVNIISFPYYLEISLITAFSLFSYKNHIEFKYIEREINKYLSFAEINKDASEYFSDLPINRMLEVETKNKNLLRSSINMKRIRQQVKSYMDSLERIIDSRTSELKEYKEKYRIFYDNASFLYITFRIDGTIIEANRHTEEVFGYSRDELLGSNILDFIKFNSEKKKFIIFLNNSNNDDNTIENFELIIKTKQKKKIVVNTQLSKSFMRINNGNDTVYIVDCVMKEITSQKKLLQKNEIISNINKIVANNDNLDHLISAYAYEIKRELDYNEINIRLLSGGTLEQIISIKENETGTNNHDRLVFSNFFKRPIELNAFNEVFKDDYIIYNKRNINRISKFLISKNSKTGIIIPLIYGGQTKAILEISSNVYDEWTRDDVDTVIKTSPTLSVLFEFTDLFRKISYSESKYKNIVESSYDAILILDEFGNIRDLNKSAYELLEWSFDREGDLIGRNLNRFLKEEMHFTLINKDMKRSYRELKLITRRNNELTVDLNIVKSAEEDETRIYCVLNDVTEKYNQELQLIQASKMATLGEMSTSVAHELNQPLNNIGIIAQRFIKKLNNNKIDIDFFKQRTELLIGQIDRATKIINHMREFGRKSEKNETDMSVNKAINGIFTLISEQLKVRNVHVKLDLKDNIPNIKANSNRIEQILLNLINNARDAMEKSEEKNLTIKTYSDNKTVFIQIIDTGCGMSEKVRRKIFDPFYTTKEVGKGTGLGLSISYKLVKDYNGNISVSSVPNSGTTFTISFPAL